MNDIYYILALVGLTFIVTHSDLFDKFKGLFLLLGHKKDKTENFLYPLVSSIIDYFCCPQCFGFVVGLVASHWYHAILSNCFLDACLLSGLCYIIVSLTERKVT